ncbi:MAG: hypothetical protein ACI4DK_07755 [Lachnospiraceae bacterium]
MKLRSYLYINQRLVDDYLSTIDGSLYEEEHVRTQNRISQNAAVEAGLPITGTSGEINSDDGKTSEKTLKITYAAKLKKIVEYLDKENELNEIEDLDEAVLKKLKREDFIEVFVNMRPSKIQHLVESLNKITNVFSALGNFLSITDTDKDTMEQMRAFGEMKEQVDAGFCQVVFNPDGNENISLVAQLEKEFLLEPIEKINKQCYVLCKVQRKIKDDEEIEVDALFAGMEGIKPFMENQEDMSLSNPQEIRDVITAPGLFVLPIAIYQ